MTEFATDFFKGVPCVVTGGAGFIGSHLVDALLERGASLCVLDDLSNGSLENLAHCKDRIQFMKGDIREMDACRSACKGTAYVFHQAALGSVPRSMSDPATTLAVNAGGTANLLTAAWEAGVRRFVYASSSSVYGDSEKLPKKEGDEGRPLSPYALSKVMNEQLADVFGRCFGMEIIGLRYFNVFGPRQRPDGPYAAVIPRFFGAYSEGRGPVIYGDGEQSRDFTYVSDAVRANLLAAAALPEACGRAYNVAGGRRITINELAKQIRAICGGGAEPEYQPERSGDIRHSLADLQSAQKFLGYKPQAGIAAGLQETVKVFRFR